MTRRQTGTPANPHGNATGARRSGERPRARRTRTEVVDDAQTLPEELRKASGLTVHTLRRLRPHLATNTYADPKTGQVYSARLNPVGAVCTDGYVRIGRRHGAREQYAHRVVWESVNGDIPDGYQIDHRNHKRADNRSANLQAVTALQNIRAAVRRGRILAGTAVYNARLTDDLVRQIRAQAGQKTDVQWAAELGVDRATVGQARRGENWRHVKPCPRLRNRARPRSRR